MASATATLAPSPAVAPTASSGAALTLANVLYDNGSGLLAVTSTANLKILKTNCPGISTGDAVTFVTSPTSSAGKTVSHGYAVKITKTKGKETITSP